MKLLDKEFVPFISKEKIQQRIKELGQQITNDYKGKDLTIIGVLNGSFIFVSDLAKAIDINCDIEFTKYSSYVNTQSTGKIVRHLDLPSNLKGQHILIVEDIIDTGQTMQKILKDLKQQEPASVKIVSLLFKPETLLEPIDISYIGFEIDPKFVVGYGLDYNGKGRNIDEILVLKD